MPYDDVESNPFRIILPQMAVKNDHLLSLLLAYSGKSEPSEKDKNLSHTDPSASHRARLLQQKEPEMRMAHWVQDIFPALRSALNDDTRIISTTNLATAIMLASLEIVSPKAFGYAIPWQEHLNLARDLMRKRFPALRQMHSSSHEDQVCSFLWGWFAYLDVLGSLSGGPRGNGSNFLVPMDQSDDPDEIDCIMGFTTRCLHLLSETADLARASALTRIRPDNTVDHTWQPSLRTIELAESLDEALRESLSRQSAPCTHISFAPSGRNTLEMAATNEAFHWAALVQLHRRALGKPPSHDDVRGPVWMIMECLARIQSGTAEMGMLFPMFTAGCEVEDEGARGEILERFRNVERNGMTQVCSLIPFLVSAATYPTRYHRHTILGSTAGTFTRPPPPRVPHLITNSAYKTRNTNVNKDPEGQGAHGKGVEGGEAVGYDAQERVHRMRHPPLRPPALLLYNFAGKIRCLIPGP